MQKLLQSFRYAKSGLLTVLREEDNFQVEIIMSVAVCILGFLVHLGRGEWLFICVAITLVLSSEIINTVVEDLCNKIEPTHNNVIGKIKDMSAAFTLVMCIGSAIIGLIIFLPHFF